MQNVRKNEYNDTTVFKNFANKNPNWKSKDKYNVNKVDDPVYQRVTCEAAMDVYKLENETVNYESIQATYKACINVETGDIYMDCSKKLIFLKHFGLFVYIRPLHVCLKTLWHASIIGPLLHEIFKACTDYHKDQNGEYVQIQKVGYEAVEREKRIRYQKKDENFVESETGDYILLIKKEEGKKIKIGEFQKVSFPVRYAKNENGEYIESTEGTYVQKIYYRYEKYDSTNEDHADLPRFTQKNNGKKFRANLWHSCQDIVRTPVYGIIMMATYLFGMLAACVGCPRTLYHTRAFAGKMERALLRIQNKQDLNNNYWMLHPCFSPMNNIAKSLSDGKALLVDSEKTVGQKTIGTMLKHIAETKHPDEWNDTPC